MLLSITAALVLGQFLPGLALAELLKLGRHREERVLFGAILGGPLSALVYYVTLVLEAPPVYWTAIVGLDAAAVVLWVRGRRASSWGWPSSSRWALAAVATAAIVPYLLTTGSLYRIDDRGSFIIDRALQRDALFHLGIIRSLSSGASASPALLSVSGEPVGYHAGYHYQVAAWARFFGVEPMDGLIRAAAVFHLALLILSAYALARRAIRDEAARVLFAVLVLGSGLGFLFFSRPSVDWWSLTFMDVTLVSVFLANPLLPALPLLFAGFAMLQDYLDDGGLAHLAGLSIAFGSLLVVKMFTGAQVLAALGLAAFFGAGTRCFKAFAASVVVSSPLLAHTFLAAEGSNTAVTLRPLEVVRYSMEKLDWEPAVSALAEVGAFSFRAAELPLVVAASVLWLLGFLGLRLIGLRDLVSDGKRSSPLAWFAVIGFPLTLLFRVAPAEAEGLSRLEAQNDVVWFATQSGIVLWLWTASVLGRRPWLGLAAAILLALPATVQHFVHAASLEPDRMAPSRVEAALEARPLPPPAAVWLDPLERSRPSLLPYLSGRAVVYDPYVGYDYMFFGRAEVDFRRHAVAQFWASRDPSYQAWVLQHFGVSYVWREGVDESARDLLDPLFENADVTLYRVRPAAVSRARQEPIQTPRVIPLGGRGHPFISRGLDPQSRRWRLSRTGSALYVPRDAGEPLDIVLSLHAPHDAGRLSLGGQSVELDALAAEARFSLDPARAGGLFAVDAVWDGSSPLEVAAIELARFPPDGRTPTNPR